MQGDKKSSDMIKIQRHDKKFQRSFHENARARRKQVKSKIRTSDGGNGNHSVSLPIILIKIKVDQMLTSSYISSLLVSIL